MSHPPLLSRPPPQQPFPPFLPAPLNDGVRPCSRCCAPDAAVVACASLPDVPWPAPQQPQSS
eukprot:365386-Chlamydomonas_euryale.AAC.2